MSGWVDGWMAEWVGVVEGSNLLDERCGVLAGADCLA